MTLGYPRIAHSFSKAFLDRHESFPLDVLGCGHDLAIVIQLSLSAARVALDLRKVLERIVPALNARA
jgi:hypothetical protein